MKIIKLIVSLLALICMIMCFKTESIYAPIGLLVMVLAEIGIYVWEKRNK